MSFSYLVTAQEGHELDTLGWYNFLREYPNSGKYAISHNNQIPRNPKTPIRFGDPGPSVHFFGESDFSDYSIKSRAYFLKARFGLNTRFSSVQFQSIANFHEAYFDSSANFLDVKFHSQAFFEGVQFDSFMSFRRVHFIGLTVFRNAILNSNVRFSSAQFDHLADFNNSTFNSTTYFIDVRFGSVADFSRCHFESKTHFISTDFDSLANFNHVSFDSIVEFQTNFHHLASFKNSYFSRPCIYRSNRFFGGVDFSEVQFGRYSNNKPDKRFYEPFEFLLPHVDFSDALFNYLADFSNSHFYYPCLFDGSRFDTKVDFTNAKFRDQVSFKKTILPDTLFFRNVESLYIIDLIPTLLDSATKQEGGFCMIDLRSAPIDKFHLFYDKFRIYWPNPIHQTEYEELTQVYEGLLKNFKDRSYLNSYATLDKEYQAFKDLQNPDASEIKKLLNKINYYWNNYGYNKERIWVWTLVFLALATLFNWLAFPYLVKDVYTVPMIDRALFKGKSWKQKQFVGIPLLWNTIRLNFKHLRLAFFYTCLIFFGLKISTERINFEKYGGVTLIFTEYLVGLICLGYLANFIISSGLIGK